MNMNIQKDILDKLDDNLIKEMQHIWFTADLHAQHPKMVDICNRPTTREEHDEWLLKEVFNKYVEKKDEVYIIGDISLGKRKDAEKWIARMNGNKHLILGNHDKNISHLGNFNEITQIKDFTFSRGTLNIHIVLCHYPMASWNRKIHGSWHLYGHVHGRFQAPGLAWDCGIDNRNVACGVFGWCRPINLYEVCLIMSERELVAENNNSEIDVE
jgi:calcineurin-like phosphoesterase family protein